jgi:long-chain acyl-CoA synthetase
VTDAFYTVPGMIRAHAAARPDHDALIQDGRRLSYAELDARMDRVAAALQRDGVAPTESLAVCASTSLAYATLFLGALRAGVAVAPLAPSSTAEQLAGMVADSGAKLFFLDGEVEAAMAGVIDRVTARRIRLEAFDDWLAPEGAKPTPVDIRPEWPFNIIYSSGTTGTPKGIVQSHAMRFQHVNRGEASGYGPEAVTLLSTPLYSNTTLVSFFPTMALGGAAVLMKKFDAREYLRLAQVHRVTHTMLVPVHTAACWRFPNSTTPTCRRSA